VSGPGITLDTGALIALERGQAGMRRRMLRARALGIAVTVPSVVLAEWWRAGFGRKHRDILAPMFVEPTSERVAKAAGLALSLASASVVDAIVMASAALRGDVVFTSDLDDLSSLQRHFPAVRLFGTSGQV
jgi:predicted nucleic acid-binding protein